MSVTPRTAGFNTISMGSLLPVTSLVLIILMWIGGSPASTAGGIKTTTFAVSILNVINIARGKTTINVFRREITHHSVHRAYGVMFLSLVIIMLGVIMLNVLMVIKVCWR
jgi:Trk-type K+ transport system membrane component